MWQEGESAAALALLPRVYPSRRPAMSPLDQEVERGPCVTMDGASPGREASGRLQKPDVIVECAICADAADICPARSKAEQRFRDARAALEKEEARQ